MSKEGDKASVFRTTKVRTRLRDDNSWLQRSSEPEQEKSEEKPWLAEVRASRVNGAPIETSPVSSPIKPTPPPVNSETQRPPTSGFMIRGVFTKLDKPDPPPSSPSANGTSKTTQFIKKPSETYKKIAPYTVKPSLDNQGSKLSPEEQEKRTEAASNVVRKTAPQRRSYVLSAAKKYESKADAPDTPPVNNSLAFVAKRVEITDDDENATTPAPAITTPRTPVSPNTSVTSAPLPKPRKQSDTSVKTPVDVAAKKPEAPKEEEKVAIPEPFKKEPVLPSVIKPVVPKVEEKVAAPAPEKEDPSPLAVIKPTVPEPVKEDSTPVSVVPEVPKVEETAIPEPTKQVQDLVVVFESVAPEVENKVVVPEPAKQEKTLVSVVESVVPKVEEETVIPEPTKQVQDLVSVFESVAPEVENKVVVPKPAKQEKTLVSVVESLVPKEEEEVVIPEPSKQDQTPVSEVELVVPKVEEETVNPEPAKQVHDLVSVFESVASKVEKEDDIPKPAKKDETPLPLVESVVPKVEEKVVVPEPTKQDKTPVSEVELVVPKVEEETVNPEPTKQVHDLVSVFESVASKAEEDVVAPEPAKEDPAPVSVPEKDPFEGMEPGCTKVDTPLPVLLPQEIEAISTEPEAEDATPAGQDETPLVDFATESTTPLSPILVSPPAVPLSPTLVSPTRPPVVPLSPTPVSPIKTPVVPLSPTPVSPTKTPAVPLSPTPVSPVKTPAAPLSPPPVSPIKSTAVPLSPTPVSPTKPPVVPLSPTQETPIKAPIVPLSPTQVAPTPAPALPKSPPPVSLTSVSPDPLSPTLVSSVKEILVKTEPEPVSEPEPSPKTSSDVDTLRTLSDTLISFNTSSASAKDDEPELAQEEEGSVDSHAAEDGEEEPAPEISNFIPITDDLLPLTGPEKPSEPVPPSPRRWNQDLLSELDRESSPAKSSDTVDLLKNDVILRQTEERSLSTQPEEEEATDETAKETQSSTETVTVTTKTVIITDKSEEDAADPWSSHVRTSTVTTSSSADPFDPYPIGTTSPNSSSDLLKPRADISINRVSTTTVESQDPSPDTYSWRTRADDPISTSTETTSSWRTRADDPISTSTETTSLSRSSWRTRTDDPISTSTETTSSWRTRTDDPISTTTETTSSRRSWTRTWDTSTTRQTYTDRSEDTKPAGQAEDQNMVVTFERKSKENDSPWDRWTSPTVYTITSSGQDDDEEEESYDTQTQTVTTITTVREIHREPEPVMDRYDTYSRTVIEEERRAPTPEPESKKGFVFVKEYVNASETSLHNARDTADGGLDYITSRSTDYSYKSPSSVSLSSTCNYCGKQVGNDAKISIEHLNINCHPACFECGVCKKPMGDLLYSMFIHEGKVHCEGCYSKALD